MNIKVLKYLFLAHAGLSFGAFLLLNVWAAGYQDSGGVDAGATVSVLAAGTRYVLLQPLAHWLIEGVALRWWTWPGLLALLALVLANSLVVTLLLAGAVRALHGTIGRLRGTRGRAR